MIPPELQSELNAYSTVTHADLGPSYMCAGVCALQREVVVSITALVEMFHKTAHCSIYKKAVKTVITFAMSL